MATDGPRTDHVGRALEALDDLLDWFHDTVLRPIIKVGRAVAFSLVLVLVGLVIAICALIALVRVFDVYAFASHQWISYLAVSALFTAIGLLAWRRRRPVRTRS